MRLYNLIESSRQPRDTKKLLYHGTNAYNLDGILENGLMSTGKERDPTAVRCQGPSNKSPGHRNDWVFTTGDVRYAVEVASKTYDHVLVVLKMDPKQSLEQVKKDSCLVDDGRFVKKYQKWIENGHYREVLFDRVPLKNILGIVVYHKDNTKTLYYKPSENSQFIKINIGNPKSESEKVHFSSDKDAEEYLLKVLKVPITIN